MRTERFGFRLSTAFTAVVGTLSLLLTGEAHPLLSWPALFIPLGYHYLYLGRPSFSRLRIGLFVFAELFVFAADALFISQDVLISVLHLSIFFQALKAFDINTLDDHTQVHFMGLLQIIIVSELTLSIWFAALLLIFMVNLVYSLMDGYLNGEKAVKPVPLARPAGPVAFWILVVLVALFVAIPRTSWHGFWGRSHIQRIRTTGFSGQVDFGSYGTVKQDDTVVMRVELSGPVPYDLYWRGSTLERFDGSTWHQQGGRTRPLFASRDRKFRFADRTSGENLLLQTVYLEPINTDVVFTLSSPVELEGTFPSLRRNDGEVLRLSKQPRGRIRYSVRSDIRAPIDRTPPASVHLELPPELAPVARQAGLIAGNQPDEREKIRALLRYFHSAFTYSLTTSAPDGDTGPVEHFLFETRTGYCEHFATAMALMLRTLGIPSRIVTGFLGGEINPVGNYVIVRQSDAHAWVEAFVEGRWERYDPTPPAPVSAGFPASLFFDSVRMLWFKYVVSFSSLEQRRALRFVETGLARFRNATIATVRKAPLPLFIGAGLLIAAAAWLVARGTLRGGSFALRRNDANHLYGRILRRLARQGFPRHPSETAREHAARIARDDGPGEIRRAADLYYRDRFGGEDHRRDLKEILKRIGK